MKYYSLLFLCLLPIAMMAQIDSLQTKIKKKENRFQVAGSVLKNGILSVPNDFSEMGKNISSDWKKTAIYAGSILGLIAVDKYTTGFWHDHVETNIKYELPMTNFQRTKLGEAGAENSYLTLPIAGLYAGSLIFNNKKGQIVAVNATKAIAYSYLISHLVLKSTFARNRPQRRINDDNQVVKPWTKDPWDFFNQGSNNYVPFDIRRRDHGAEGNSFPSFHATFYFSVAKVFQMEYNNYWIPYTVAAGAFLSNIKGHDHWISDLAAAGIIGTVIGRAVVKSSRKQIEKSKNTASLTNPKKIKMNKFLTPQISTNNVGFHFVGTF